MHGLIGNKGRGRQVRHPRRNRQRDGALSRGYAAACARMGRPIEPETDQEAVRLFGT